MSLDSLRSAAFDGELTALDWKPSVAQVPSPSWWASDSAIYSATTADGRAILAKVVSPVAWAFRNLGPVFAAGRAAGEAGLGPRQIAADPATGVVLYEKLDARWRVGRLDLLADPRTRRGVLAERRAFGALALGLPERDHYAEILGARDEALDAKIIVDPRILALIEEVQPYREGLETLLAERPRVSSAGEGTVSNFMISDTRAAQLVGWGSACTLTDLGEIATLAAELTPAVISVPTLLREYRDSEPDAREIAAVELLALLDDVRWAMLLVLRAEREPNPDLDVTKYALWRMTKAQLALGLYRSNHEGVLK